MIDTQKLRKAAEGANEFAGSDVAEWPLITKNHIRFLASTAIQCADTIDAQEAEIARLREALTMAESELTVLGDELECVNKEAPHLVAALPSVNVLPTVRAALSGESK